MSQFPSPIYNLSEQNTRTHQADKQFFRNITAFNSLYVQIFLDAPQPISPPRCAVSHWELHSFLWKHFVISLPSYLTSTWPVQKYSYCVYSSILSGKRTFFFFLNKHCMRKLISRKTVLSIIVTQVLSTENIDDHPPAHKTRSPLTAQDRENLENDFFSFLSSLTGYRKMDWVIWLVPTSPMSCPGKRPR